VRHIRGRVFEGAGLYGNGINDHKLMVMDCILVIDADGYACGLEDRNLGVTIVGGLVVGNDTFLDATVSRGFDCLSDVARGELIASDEQCCLGGRDGLQDDIKR
jgi:hypothetical protein